jgi:hypothetical protein
MFTDISEEMVLEEAAGSSETLVTVDQTAWCDISKDSNLQYKKWFCYWVYSQMQGGRSA